MGLLPNAVGAYGIVHRRFACITTGDPAQLRGAEIRACVKGFQKAIGVDANAAKAMGTGIGLKTKKLSGHTNNS